MTEIVIITQQTDENNHIGMNEKKSFEESKSNVLQMMNNFKTEDDAIKFLNWIKDDALEELQRTLLRANLNYQDQNIIDQSVDNKSDMKMEEANSKNDISLEESMEESPLFEEQNYKDARADPLKVEETNSIGESLTTEIDVPKLNCQEQFQLVDNKPDLKMEDEETILQNHFSIDVSIDSDKDEYSQSLDSSQFEEQEFLNHWNHFCPNHLIYLNWQI